MSDVLYMSTCTRIRITTYISIYIYLYPIRFARPRQPATGKFLYNCLKERLQMNEQREHFEIEAAMPGTCEPPLWVRSCSCCCSSHSPAYTYFTSLVLVFVVRE